MRSRAAQYLAAIAFGLASSVHAGVLFTGFEHSKAATAEGVIAAVLALGIISFIAIVEADGIALMLTEWQATDAAPQHAIDIACRQPDGNVALARRGPVHGR
jgi:hypothetical protein